MINRMHFEYDELAKIESIIENKKCCFIVGRNSFTKSGFEVFLKNSRINNYIIYSDFSINPKFDEILNAVKVVKGFDPEIIVGIGGGSVLDTAKLVSIFATFPKDKIIEKYIIGDEIILERNIELCLIPTTAGSGSEATHFAVVYIGNMKYSVSSKYLLPDYVILDPYLTESLPTKQSFISAFDAFSQAVESIWSIHSTEESRDFAFKALELLNQNLDKLMLSPNIETRKNLLIASNLAGKAINITKTTGPHALSYFLTINFGIPHGLAVFILLRQFIYYNSPENLSRLKPEISKSDYLNRYNLILDAVNVDTVDELSQRVLHLFKVSELPISFNEIIKYSKLEIDMIANSVNLQRLENNPMALNKKDILDILNNIV